MSGLARCPDLGGSNVLLVYQFLRLLLLFFTCKVYNFNIVLDTVQPLESGHAGYWENF